MRHWVTVQCPKPEQAAHRSLGLPRLTSLAMPGWIPQACHEVELTVPGMAAGDPCHLQLQELCFLPKGDRNPVSVSTAVMKKFRKGYFHLPVLHFHYL